SADGRFVSFQETIGGSYTPIDGGSVYVRDLQTGVIERVGYGIAGQISADGQYVSFQSEDSLNYLLSYVRVVNPMAPAVITSDGGGDTASGSVKEKTTFV